MNREPLLSLDVCLSELLQKQQHTKSQVAMKH